MQGFLFFLRGIHVRVSIQMQHGNCFISQLIQGKSGGHAVCPVPGRRFRNVGALCIL